MNRNITALFSLKDKVSVVIGGAQNFGYYMAKALVEAGGDVVV